MKNNKKENIVEPNCSHYIISDIQVFSLQQEIFTLIQSFGLKEEQEKAILYLLNQKILKFLDFYSFVSNKDYIILKEKKQKK